MSDKLTTTGGGELIVIESLPMDRNAAAVFLARFPNAGTRRGYHAALDKIALIVSNGRVDAMGLDWAALRFQHTAAIRARLVQMNSPGTVNRQLTALRGVLKTAWKLGQMDAEEYRRAKDLEGIKYTKLPTGRNISPGEIAAMFQACADDQTAAGVRDAALLALLRLGLRRAEVAGLELADYNRQAESVKVVGKGDKERLVYARNGAEAALTDWLELRGDEPGPLLYAVNKGGRILKAGITPQAVYNIANKRAAQANVKNLTPHDWRRTYAGDMLDAGADLVLVQKLMGHANPTTTSQYDRRPEEAKRQAAGRIHVPWTRRTLST